MDCKEFLEGLDAMLDGDGGEQARQRFEAHAAQCDGCRAQLRAAETLKNLLRSLPDEVAVPLPAQAAWRKAVREECARKRRTRLLRYGSVAAAVVVLAVGVFGSGLTRKNRLANMKDVSAPVAVESEKAAEEVADGAIPAEDLTGAVPMDEAPVANDEMMRSDDAEALDGEMMLADDAEVADEAPMYAMSEAAEPLDDAEIPDGEMMLADDAEAVDEAPMYAMSEAAEPLDDAEIPDGEMMLADDAEVADEAPAYAMADEALVIDGDAPMVESDGLAAMEESASFELPAAVSVERALVVKDLDAALQALGDLAEEYGCRIDRRTEDADGWRVYLQVPGEEAAAFLEAAQHLSQAEASWQAPEADGPVDICLVLTEEKE